MAVTTKDRLKSADQGSQTNAGKPDRATIQTRCVSAHLPVDMYWQLKELAASQRMEMRNVIAASVNAYFRECNRPVFEVKFDDQTPSP